MRFRDVLLPVLCFAAASGTRAELGAQVSNPPPPTSPDSAPAFPPGYVWTTEPDAPILTLSGPIVVPRVFTRLEVLGSDSLGILVRCGQCEQPGVGFIDATQVVYAVESPAGAADGSLGEFLWALRDAASRRDLDALRAVMAPDFTYSLLLASGRLEAFRHWQYRRYRALDRLPELLDRGVVSQDERIWVAPPEHLEDPAYQDLRAGFRRENGRWVWLFLVTEEDS